MKKLVYIVIAMFLFQCRERYDVPFETPDTGFLVVEGFIDVNGQTKFSLSRTTKLSEFRIVHENGAVVAVEGEDNSEYIIAQSDSGTYAALHPELDNAVKYRLNIRTSGGKQYLSEFRSPVRTPAIDRLSWIRENGSLQIFVNSYDPNRATNYYKWDFEETWEFESAYESNLKFNINNSISPVEITADFANAQRLPDYGIFRCWQSRASSGILIGTTVKLSEDRIYIPMVRYPEGSWELSDLYSIKVRQYALSREGYEFYSRMKKNTESIGAIFDPQPSEIRGNISCVSNPSEIVIGYVDVSTVEEKRLFITNSELPGWDYNEGCELTGYYVNQPDAVFEQIYTRGLYPVMYYSLGLGGQVLSFFAAPATCVDCTLRGSNQKPSFWP